MLRKIHWTLLKFSFSGQGSAVSCSLHSRALFWLLAEWMSSSVEVEVLHLDLFCVRRKQLQRFAWHLRQCIIFAPRRRIDVKVPTSVLRSLIPQGRDPHEHEEINGSDSEGDAASDHDTSSVASREAQPRTASSNGSLVEQSAAADETRRALAAAMKQQQRRRAAAAAAAAAASRLTAMTIAGLEWCTDTQGLLSWGTSGSEFSRECHAHGKDEDGRMLEGSWLLFTGTSTLRNGVWCSPVEALSTAGTSGPSVFTPAASITARPLVSLFTVLQQLNNEKSENESTSGPHVAQLVVVPQRRLLLVGTSDGRVIMFPADTPTACAAVS